MALTYTRRIELVANKAVTTIDLMHVVFEETERATYEQCRKVAKHISRSDLAHIHWILQVQPMQDERCYLYKDKLIVSLGGWWTCVLPDMGFSYMQDGTLDGMMDRIDEAINTKLAKDAIKAVLQSQRV
jgi:hypothetical protein